MPYIKLDALGFENVTGFVGSIEFKDGVSVEPVAMREAERLGGIMRVVDAETGEELNAAKGMSDRLKAAKDEDRVDNKPTVVDDGEKTTSSESQKESDEVDEQEKQETSAQEVDKPKIYTEAELADIADREGIAGLRKIGDELDVSDKSVRGLIAKILKKQA